MEYQISNLYGHHAFVAVNAIGFSFANKLKRLWKSFRKFFLRYNSIAFLGMKGAGKTQMIRTLQGIPYDLEKDPSTTEEHYDSFHVEIEGKKYKIEEGTDYGGGNSYVGNNWVNMINKSDVVFFVFDIFQYLNDEEYSEQVNARLDFLYRHKCNYTNTAVFGSNLDKCQIGQDIVEMAQKKIENKEYSAFFTTNFFCGDTRNFDDVKKMSKMLF